MPSSANLELQLPNYRPIEQLYLGSRTIVYRAVAKSDGRSVIIKLLYQEYPSFNDLLQFRNQYLIAKDLDIPGIVRPHSLESVGNSYALVMADSGGVSIETYCQTPSLSVGEILSVGIQLAEILHQLNLVGIIHKDIKPANILIQPQTKQVQLLDFSIASRLPKENQELLHPNRLEGTLAYLAPEQTGRMNRGIDYRTDFYSLGVTLYQLLTGKLPFDLSLEGNTQSVDLLELIHCHIAQTPVPVDTIAPNVPQMVAKIVAKLMAKTAEERYQSAIGLKYDLSVCLEQWERTGTVVEFPLASRDLSCQFTIPERLYGRECEIEMLLAAFERTSHGAAELILIAGLSGIGKTAVVNEIHKPITRSAGYFIRGKFDQFNRSMPLSAFVQAFGDLVSQILSESDTRIAEWKTYILAALGENAQRIVDVIPELAQIIGKQPPVLELTGAAAQNRFNLLFQKFIRVFATAEHPLTIFLDDLQWADPASIESIQLLMDGSQQGYLLLIGAYRDNEVSPAHPLMLSVGEIAKTSTVKTITLQPLAPIDFQHLVADTLGCHATVASPLAELTYRKTQGNPFFATQFLKALHQDKLISFDRQNNVWECDLTQINAASLTDDVLIFMSMQLQKLPPATLEILKLAACLGDRFDLATLAIVADQTATQVAELLWISLQAGLIIPQNQVYKFFSRGLERDDPDRLSFALAETNYRFLHDRVQQAAYALIPPELKQVEHFRIGQLLLTQMGSEVQGDKLFTLINHLNIGRELLTDPVQLATIARLNLAAAKQARLSTAYRAALAYAEIGIVLLAPTGWKQEYDRFLDLHNVAAEAAFLCGDFTLATHLVETVIRQTRTVLDRIPVYETQLQLFTSQKNYQQSIEWGLRILRELGMKIPTNPHKLQMLGGLVMTKCLLFGKSMETLLNLPQMQDVQIIATMQILYLMTHPAYFVSQDLLGLIGFVGVQKSIKSGNSIWSAAFYGVYASAMAEIQDFPASYQFGQFSLALLDKFPNPEIEACIIFDVAFISQPCQQRLEDSLPLHQAAIRSALKSGDIIYAGLSYFGDCLARLGLGKQPLDQLSTLAAAYQIEVAAMNDRTSLFLIKIVSRVIINLQDVSCTSPTILEDEAADFRVAMELEANQERITANFFCASKKYLYYLFNDIPNALKYADLYYPYAAENAALYGSVQAYFFEGLIRLAAYPTSSHNHQKELLKRIAEIQKVLILRAKDAPYDIRDRRDLLAAERYRTLGKYPQAIDLYDIAIERATAREDYAIASIGNELAAKFYLGWDKPKISAVYMQAAYYDYARWGAFAKTEDLKRRYPQLLKPIIKPSQPEFNPLETLALVTNLTTDGLNFNGSVDFDLTSVLRSAQVLSSTIEIEELVTKLIQIILQNSGAETCILALPNRDSLWQLHQMATVTPTGIQTSSLDCSLSSDLNYPSQVISVVKNTSQVMIFDASTSREINCPYLREYQPRSVFCLPIIKHSQTFGVIYLEHRQIPQLFVQDRQVAISFLCSQAAIALENAKLYQDIQIAAANLQIQQNHLVTTNQELVRATKLKDEFLATMSHELRTPLNAILGMSECLQEEVFGTINERQAKSIATIEHSGQHLLALINDILDVSKIAAGKLELEISTVCIATLCESSFTFIKQQARQKQIYLKTRLSPELGTILIDERRMRQVLMNLLSNAVKFTPNGGTVTLTACKIVSADLTVPSPIKDRSSDWLCLGVIDTGIGIAPADCDRLFQPFIQIDSGLSRQYDGTGLGLVLVKEMVELHGGFVTLKSEVGEGSCFSVYFPIVC